MDDPKRGYYKKTVENVISQIKCEGAFGASGISELNTKGESEDVSTKTSTSQYRKFL